MTSKTTNKFSPALRARAVLEHKKAETRRGSPPSSGVLKSPLWQIDAVGASTPSAILGSQNTVALVLKYQDGMIFTQKRIVSDDDDKKVYAKDK